LRRRRRKGGGVRRRRRRSGRTRTSVIVVAVASSPSGTLPFLSGAVATERHASARAAEEDWAEVEGAEEGWGRCRGRRRTGGGRRWRGARRWRGKREGSVAAGSDGRLGNRRRRSRRVGGFRAGPRSRTPSERQGPFEPRDRRLSQAVCRHVGDRYTAGASGAGQAGLYGVPAETYRIARPVPRQLARGTRRRRRSRSAQRVGVRAHSDACLEYSSAARRTFMRHLRLRRRRSGSFRLV
jgi:hypothetical protein